jgi:glycosyltransferase involved in cell wall biosynthesis
MKTCVLIPSYNEEKMIGTVIAGVKSLGIEVFVVDDGSTDATYERAVSAGAKMLRNHSNEGKGYALREGFAHILKQDFDAVIVIDGDNQHETDSIPDLLRRMDQTGADIIIGNRMADSSVMPFVRKITNVFMSWFLSRLCGQQVPDTQCGFRLIKRGVLESIALKSSNFEIESELIIRAAKKGFKIESVPIKAVYEDQKSSINPILDTIRFITFVLRVSSDK